MTVLEGAPVSVCIRAMRSIPEGAWEGGDEQEPMYGHAMLVILSAYLFLL